MKRTITFIFGLFLCVNAQATPPGDLNVTYDLANGTITVQGPHPSEDVNEHYIRRLEVSVNNGEIQKFYFPRQSSAPEFKETVKLALKPKDFVQVKVSCSQGGSQTAELKIPEEQAPVEEPVDLKQMKDKDHGNIQVIP